MAPSSKPANATDDEWMSVQQAMDALGLSRVNVLHLAVKGTLTAQTVANRTVVRRDSVDAEIARRQSASLAGGAA